MLGAGCVSDCISSLVHFFTLKQLYSRKTSQFYNKAVKGVKVYSVRKQTLFIMLTKLFTKVQEGHQNYRSTFKKFDQSDVYPKILNFQKYLKFMTFPEWQ